MLYLIDYNQETPRDLLDMSSVQIIRILWKAEKFQKSFPQFLEKYSNKTIFIKLNEAPTPSDNEFFTAIFNRYKNIELEFPRSKEYKDKTVPFHFSNLVTDWDAYYNDINAGVASIYLGNNLNFEFLNVVGKSFINKVKLLICPNRLQNTYSRMGHANDFFIRPDAIKYYNRDFVYFYFSCKPDRQKILIDIYNKQEWWGDLREIIVGLQEPLWNNAILSVFDLKRLNCKKQCCAAVPRCNICMSCQKLSVTALDNKILEKIDK